MKKRLIVLTGAGISAESGIRTFRDEGGLWEGYDVMEVASIDGWERNPRRVLQFYNERRAALQNAEPNAAHRGLAALEENFDVQIITQNVDDLHERAGSSKVLHLHGQLNKARSVLNDDESFDWPGDINWGDRCPAGGQVRPHIVWFGEAVPMIEPAARLAATADIFAVIGTSLLVYPAAGLVQYAPSHADIYVIDPKSPVIRSTSRVHYLRENATTGVAQLQKILADAK